MHKRFLFSLLLAALAGTLLLGSCGLIGNEETQADSNYFRATLNGDEVWTAGGTTKTNRLFDANGFEWLTLRVAHFPGPATRYAYRETLEFRVTFRGTGMYSLVEGTPEGAYEETGSVYREGEGDVIFTRYHPTEDSSANQLTITSYDSTTGIMTGTFHTTLVITEDDEESEPGEPPRRQPDTLRFTDGEFRVKVGHQ